LQAGSTEAAVLHKTQSIFWSSESYKPKPVDGLGLVTAEKITPAVPCNYVCSTVTAP